LSASNHSRNSSPNTGDSQAENSLAVRAISGRIVSL
jgi:hypothetical protein